MSVNIFLLLLDVSSSALSLSLILITLDSSNSRTDSNPSISSLTWPISINLFSFLVILFSRVFNLLAADVFSFLASIFKFLFSSILASASANCCVKSVFLNSSRIADTPFISLFAKLYNSSNTDISRNWARRSFLSDWDFSINAVLLFCTDKVVKIKSSYDPTWLRIFLFVSYLCSPFNETSWPFSIVQKLTFTVTLPLWYPFKTLWAFLSIK